MKKGMKKVALTAVSGATRYEFTMQARRKSVWIVMGVFSLLMLTGSDAPWKVSDGMPLAEAVAKWAITLQVLLPLAFGLLLANRLPRDHSTQVSELLIALPAGSGARLAGKYLGSTLATMAPMALLYSVGIFYLLADRGDLTAIPLGIVAFCAINVPGLLFVGAFSVSCPAVLWVPLYQLLFVGYWFWGNFLLQGPQSPLYNTIPSLSGTLLTPAGYYASGAFFGVSIAGIQAVVWEGVVSICLLVGLGALALLCAHWYLRWRQARQ